MFKDERPTDRTVLWRVSAWSGIALISLTGAILLARSPVAARHTALNDAHVVIAAQARQLQHLIQQNDSETRRLAAAMNTLNGDRDRLYQRVTDVERSLDTVTGSVTKLAARPAPALATPPPVLSAPQSVPVAIKFAPIPPEPFSPPGNYEFVAQAPKADMKTDITASVTPKPPVTPAAKTAAAALHPRKTEGTAGRGRQIAARHRSRQRQFNRRPARDLGLRPARPIPPRSATCSRLSPSRSRRRESACNCGWWPDPCPMRRASRRVAHR